VKDHSRDLLFLLNDIGRLLRTEADRRAKMHGMTRAQWGILLWLERQPGLSQRELAEILEVEPITVARLVDRLEARQMVERRPDCTDRRIWRLHLTNAATAVLGDIHENCDAMAATVTMGMPAGAQAKLIEMLSTMKSILSAERRADTKEVA
jgi:DNA-binding MarR family transcriptional regulator